MFSLAKIKEILNPFNVCLFALLLFVTFAAVSNFNFSLFGKSRDTLIEQNVNAQRDIQMLTEVAKENEATRALEKALAEDNQTAVATVTKLRETSRKSTTAIQQKYTDKTEEIRSDPLVPEAEKEIKEAAVQIDMLWENYCRIEKSSCTES